MNAKKISIVIEDLLDFIAKAQEKDGSFVSVIGKKDLIKSTEKRQTTFATSVILESLEGLKNHKKVVKIANQGISFLLKEQSLAGSWNYWSRSSTTYNTTPYPDDLDDTALALIALTAHRKTTVTGKTFANLTKLLYATEEKVGGPYHTWIIDHKKNPRWRDIDIAVNANIAYFLKLHEVELPNLQKLFNTHILKGAFPSKYYFSPLSVIYFITRAYAGNNKKKLLQSILKKQRKDGGFGNVIETAFAVNSLLNLRGATKDIDHGIQYLLTHIDEANKPFPIYIEENKKETIYSGSGAVTAALVIEALSKYQESLEISIESVRDKKASLVHEKIVRQAKAILKPFPKKLKDRALIKIEAMLAHDKNQQITLLPYYFTQSLKKNNFDEQILIQLGIANLSGWLAYTIYDDIFDGDTDAALLPLANIYLQEVCSIYTDLLPKSFLPLFHTLMQNMEIANVVEWAECGLGREEKQILPPLHVYKNIADKSLPHALGPITLLALSGEKAQGKNITCLLSFFKAYITARQLNDDAHDWLPDLKKGYINGIARNILASYKKQSRQDWDTKLPEKIIFELQKIFWYEEIDTTLKQIHTHLKQAEIALTKLTVLTDKTYLQKLLAPLYRAAERTIEEKTRMQDFLKNY